MTAPGCPHGVKTLSPDGRWWLCPSDQGWRCEPEEISAAYPPIPTQSSGTLRTGRPDGYVGNGRRPTREATGKPAVRVIPRPVRDFRRAVRMCPDVTGSNLTVALLLSEYADYGTGMECFPSAKTIAAQMGFTSARQVRTCLRWLETTGWVHDTGRTVESDGPHRGAKIRWLTIPDCPHSHDGSALPDVKD